MIPQIKLKVHSKLIWNTISKVTWGLQNLPVNPWIFIELFLLTEPFWFKYQGEFEKHRISETAKATMPYIIYSQLSLTGKRGLSNYFPFLGYWCFLPSTDTENKQCHIQLCMKLREYLSNERNSGSKAQFLREDEFYRN